MDLLDFVVGGTLVLLGLSLGVWGTLYVQRWTLNHSAANRVLERTDPLYPLSDERDADPPFESRIASGESILPDRRGMW